MQAYVLKWAFGRYGNIETVLKKKLNGRMYKQE
jgi:hypothetical protein